ncbi:MAG TPA: TrkA family potassium uptake protein [Mycobacteriales bacterium]|nr:TrkA family potassium uptake protein [Mycobacteriales bacterium]
MHVVIMGCGRVGSTLALRLEQLGHSVAIVDRDAGAFRRLPKDFTGRSVVGVGFDRETLVEAGIEQAEAFAAVSNGDNSNIISARVAREQFGVEHVAARIYDPRRAEVYQRLGIPTVATVKWTADQVLRRLLPAAADDEWTDPSGRVCVAQIDVPSSWVGRRYSELENAAGARVACLTRLGIGQLPVKDTVVQEGDIVHFALVREQLATVEAAVTGGPEGAH